jgi:hypothetical protein
METLIGTIIPFAGHYEFDYGTIETRIVEEEKLILQGVKNAMTLAEKGWLLCNGKAIFMNDSQLSKLFEVIGFLWGEGDSPDTNVNPFPYFRIPDFCGLFLRGAYSNQTKRDPDMKNRKRIYPNDRFNPYLVCPGSYQSYDSDLFNIHKTGTEPFYGGNINNKKGIQVGTGNSVGQPDVKVGGIETRPKNVYVNYLVKVSDNAIDINKLYKDNEVLRNI